MVEARVTRPVLLLESILTDTRVVLGHLRPLILVPLGFLTSLPSDQVEAILLHELAHVVRADYLVNVCQRILEGLLFYHPAAWWMGCVIRSERENCCDDAVVRWRGNRAAYAAALIQLESSRTQKLASQEPAMAAQGGNLMQRVQRLLHPRTPGASWARSSQASS